MKPDVGSVTQTICTQRTRAKCTKAERGLPLPIAHRSQDNWRIQRRYDDSYGIKILRIFGGTRFFRLSFHHSIHPILIITRIFSLLLNMISEFDIGRYRFDFQSARSAPRIYETRSAETKIHFHLVSLDLLNYIPRHNSYVSK